MPAFVHQVVLSACLLACLAASASAVAAASAATPCNGSSDPCSIELGHVVASLERGAEAYFADARPTSASTSSDGVLSALPVFLPSVLAFHAEGVDGFSFNPAIYSNVGGSGVDGYFEVNAFFEFNGLRFDAQPGYRIDQLEVLIAGSAAWVGDAAVSFGMPGGAIFSGSSFSSSFPIDPSAANFRAEFTTSAAYLQGDDGTAISYGTAMASFDEVSFIVHVSAVPEPPTGCLLALGGVALLLRNKRSCAASLP